MELVLTNLDLEPLPKRVKEPFVPLKEKGLLNSNFKRLVRKNFDDLNSDSVYATRQRVKSRKYNFTPGIETVLKLSVFVTVFSIIFA